MADTELAEHARSLLTHTAYLTLATADADGRPWTSPVYFAADGLADFYWVSSPQARHSRNLAARPEVSLVVFDSTVPPTTGGLSTRRASPTRSDPTSSPTACSTTRVAPSAAGPS